jgi:hypothetical protein
LDAAWLDANHGLILDGLTLGKPLPIDERAAT